MTIEVIAYSRATQGTYEDTPIVRHAKYHICVIKFQSTKGFLLSMNYGRNPHTNKALGVFVFFGDSKGKEELQLVG